MPSVTEAVYAIETQAGNVASVVPEIAAAAIGVAVLILGVKLGWRLVRSLASR